jgi:asparagine synthase (glutamine-hydrolysing)
MPSLRSPAHGSGRTGPDLHLLCTLGSQTLFQGISELPPGCWLTFQEGRLIVQKYWSPDFGRANEQSREENGERLVQLLTDAVRLRLRSDVPVGAYLSGGLDSTVTTAFIKKCSDVQVRTFSIGFADSDYDETAYQEEAACFLDTEHCSMHCTARDIGRVFPDVIWHTEKPVLRTGSFIYVVEVGPRAGATVPPGGTDAESGRYRDSKI